MSYDRNRACNLRRTSGLQFMKAGCRSEKICRIWAKLQQWAGCLAIDQVEKAEETTLFLIVRWRHTGPSYDLLFKQAQNARRLAGTHIPPSDPRAKPWQRIFANKAEIRKQKREHEFRRMEIKQTILEWTTGVGLLLS